MKQEELKHSAIFETLKKDKRVQKSAVKLGKTEDWINLKQFVANLKQTLLEATLEVDSLEEIRRYKYLIRGMESIVLLPKLVDDVKKIEKENKEKTGAKSREACNSNVEV